MEPPRPTELPMAAGWYPDPSGRHELRYFDRAWTEYVSDRGRVATGGPVTPPSGSAPAHRQFSSVALPTRHRGWLLPTAITVGVVVIVVAVLAIRDGSGTATEGATSGNFCADFPANYDRIDEAWQTAVTISYGQEPSDQLPEDVTALTPAVDLVRGLAAEAPDTSFAGESLPSVIANWADFFSAARDYASSTQPDDRLLDKVKARHSESTPSLLKLMMFPDTGSALTRCTSR